MDIEKSIINLTQLVQLCNSDTDLQSIILTCTCLHVVAFKPCVLHI